LKIPQTSTVEATEIGDARCENRNKRHGLHTRGEALMIETVSTVGRPFEILNSAGLLCES
jgi:hypothetical protein